MRRHILEDEFLEDLRQEDRMTRRREAQLLRHPHPNDPDHPEEPEEDEDDDPQ